MWMNRINGNFPGVGLCSDVGHVLNEFLQSVPTAGQLLVGGARRFPPLNMWEDEGALFVETELPGLTMEDVEVTVLNDEMTIAGERKQAMDNETNYRRQERAVGRFERTIRLPMAVDAERVEASLRNGVLSIRLPKAPTSLPRRIPVNA